MRNLTKIFVTMVALVALSCTTDTTQDISVDLGNNEALTEITLSLEESRTQLGEKAGDLYPLYWSEGDQIAINGVASAPLTTEYDGKSAAVFALDGDIERPFHIVYPAPAEGVVAATSGLYPVTFPATQSYTAGTFESGTAPMYGYAATAAEGEEVLPAVEIHHLTGILRLAVKGDKTLTSMTVVAETGAIAGNFDVNCESGALTAHEDASNTITMSFGEGLALGDTATPIYVAVPAGEHGIYTITLFTDEAENNAMVVRFNSDNHPVKAGVVKEFGEVIFVPNATASPVSGELVIENEADLVRLAKMSEVGLLGSVTSVRVAASLDMSNVEGWHGIDRFPAIPFDGGSDKGFEIKGLKAPLFLTTTATIKNVKLTDVNMTSNGLLHFGAIVCDLKNNEQNSNTISNCEVSGSITINNPDFSPAASYSSIYDVISCSGLAGCIFGVPVSNCVNRADITVTQISTNDSSTTFVPAIGGIAGYVNGAADGAKCHFSNCKNYGAIVYEDNATNRCHRPCLGGIVAFGTEANTTNITECVNYGPISVNAVTYGGTGAGSGEYIGGITGRITGGVITSCKNEVSGTITLDGDLTAPTVGGIAGYTNNSKTTLSDNLGAIEIKSTARFMGLVVGGVIGCSYDNQSGDAGYMEQCTNDASIKVLGSTRENATPPSSKAYYYRIGGVCGFPRHPVTNCENKANGDILIEGDVVNMTTNTELAINIAGVVAYSTQGACTYLTNRGDITCNAHFTHNQTTIDNSKTSEQSPAIAGIICYSNYNPHHLENFGNISFGGSYNGYRAFIGGLVADGFNQNICPSESTNHGSITIEESATFTLSNYLYIGGIVAITERNKTDLVNMTNNGAINFNGTMVSGSLRVGGFTGYAKSYFSNVTNNAPITFGEKSSTVFTQVGGLVAYFAKGTSGNLSNLVNTEKGDITLNGTINGSVRLSGCIADKVAYSHTIDTCTNSGDLTVNGNVTGLLTVGGNVALMASPGADSKMKDTFTNFTNNGNITVNESVTVSGVTRIGGLIGSADLSDELVLTNFTNNGAISVKGTYEASDGDNSLNIGGVVAVLQGANNHDTLINSETGDITVDATSTKTRIRVGGVAAKIQDGTLNLTNKGDISVSGSYASTVCVSGIVALTNGYNRTNILNEGNITVSASGSTCYIGGIYTHGAWDYGQKNVVNKGNLTASKDAQFSNSVFMGGIIALRTNGKSGSGQPMKFTNGCYNSGNLTFNGTCATNDVTDSAPYSPTYNLYMGGMVGQSRTESSTSYGIRADGFVNRGNLTFNGKVEKGGAYIGGIAGDMDQEMKENYWTGTITNIGDIECNGSVSTGVYVGGIVGDAAKPFQNAECHCKISTIIYDNMSIGMILGTPRTSSIYVSNCKVGGTAFEFDEEDQSIEPLKLTANNFHRFIYGGNTDWNGVVEYDGCSFLATKPTFE